MAIANYPHQGQGQPHVPLSFAATAVKAAGLLSARPSVQQIGYIADDHEITYWAFIDRDDMGEVEALFRVIHDMRRADPSAPLINLHVVPPGKIQEAALPHFEMIYSRS